MCSSFSFHSLSLLVTCVISSNTFYQLLYKFEEKFFDKEFNKNCINYILSYLLKYFLNNYVPIKGLVKTFKKKF